MPINKKMNKQILICINEIQHTNKREQMTTHKTVNESQKYYVQ